MRVWPHHARGAWHLYGHSHGNLPDDPLALSMDVGVDSHDFRPWHFDEIQVVMKAKADARQQQVERRQAAAEVSGTMDSWQEPLSPKKSRLLATIMSDKGAYRTHCPLHSSGRSFAWKFSFPLLGVRQRSSRKRPQSHLQSGKWAEVNRAEVAAMLRTQ